MTGWVKGLQPTFTQMRMHTRSAWCGYSISSELPNRRTYQLATPEPTFPPCLSSGKVLHRGKVEEKLRQAAQQLDVPAPMASTRSLRAGGATAMWAAGYSAEEIQRRGRWVSQCFRICIWEGHERSKGVGTRMLEAESTEAKVSMFATMQSQANRDLREQLQHQRA